MGGIEGCEKWEDCVSLLSSSGVWRVVCEIGGMCLFSLKISGAVNGGMWGSPFRLHNMVRRRRVNGYMYISFQAPGYGTWDLEDASDSCLQTCVW